jgi:hypothetical protein
MLETFVSATDLIRKVAATVAVHFSLYRLITSCLRSSLGPGCTPEALSLSSIAMLFRPVMLGLQDAYLPS